LIVQVSDGEICSKLKPTVLAYEAVVANDAETAYEEEIDVVEDTPLPLEIIAYPVTGYAKVISTVFAVDALTELGMI